MPAGPSGCTELVADAPGLGMEDLAAMFFCFPAEAGSFSFPIFFFNLRDLGGRGVVFFLFLALLDVKLALPDRGVDVATNGLADVVGVAGVVAEMSRSGAADGVLGNPAGRGDGVAGVWVSAEGTSAGESIYYESRVCPAPSPDGGVQSLGRSKSESSSSSSSPLCCCCFNGFSCCPNVFPGSLGLAWELLPNNPTGSVRLFSSPLSYPLSVPHVGLQCQRAGWAGRGEEF